MRKNYCFFVQIKIYCIKMCYNNMDMKHILQKL